MTGPDQTHKYCGFYSTNNIIILRTKISVSLSVGDVLLRETVSIVKYRGQVRSETEENANQSED